MTEESLQLFCLNNQMYVITNDLNSWLTVCLLALLYVI